MLQNFLRARALWSVHCNLIADIYSLAAGSITYLGCWLVCVFVCMVSISSLVSHCQPKGIIICAENSFWQQSKFKDTTFVEAFEWAFESYTNTGAKDSVEEAIEALGDGPYDQARKDAIFEIIIQYRLRKSDLSSYIYVTHTAWFSSSPPRLKQNAPRGSVVATT